MRLSFSRFFVLQPACRPDPPDEAPPHLGRVFCLLPSALYGVSGEHQGILGGPQTQPQLYTANDTQMLFLPLSTATLCLGGGIEESRITIVVLSCSKRQNPWHNSSPLPLFDRNVQT